MLIDETVRALSFVHTRDLLHQAEVNRLLKEAEIEPTPLHDYLLSRLGDALLASGKWCKNHSHIEDNESLYKARLS